MSDQCDTPITKSSNIQVRRLDATYKIITTNIGKYFRSIYNINHNLPPTIFFQEQNSLIYYDCID